MTHTPTPWKTGGDGSVRDHNGNCIPLYSGFIAEAFYGEEQAISNAAFIATAANAYAKQRALIQELISALEHARQNMPHPDQMIDDTLATAKKEGF